MTFSYLVLDSSKSRASEKIPKLGLNIEYNDYNSEISVLYRYLVYLFTLWGSFVFDFMSIKPDDNKVTRICNYL